MYFLHLKVTLYILASKSNTYKSTFHLFWQVLV